LAACIIDTLESSFRKRHPAHDVLAHGATEQRLQRPPHAARIGAGQVGAGDQRIGSERTALIGSQRLAVLLGGPAIGRLQPGARHGVNAGVKLHQSAAVKMHHGPALAHRS
jgi:hypothetical protein